MLRFAVFLTLVPAAALAHAGHVGELAGHAHWLGLAAAAGAAVIGAWLWGQKGDDAEEAEDELPEGEEQST